MTKNKAFIKPLLWITVILLLLRGGYLIHSTLCGNLRISFYGKLVDQNGNQIPNVKIKCSTMYVFIPPFGLDDKYSTVRTDNRGCFKFRGRGMNMSVDIPRDYPGYEFIYDDNPRIGSGYAPPSRLRSGYGKNQEILVASKANPLVFTLRKKGMPAYILGNKGRGNQRILEDVLDDINTSLYLVAPWIDSDGLPGNFPGEEESKYGQVKPSGNKDLLIEGTLSTDETQFDWQISPIPPNSGIILSDELLYEAPETGYQSAIQLSVPINTIELKKYLYIKLDDGKFYGRLDSEFSVDSLDGNSSEVMILIGSWINPDGSRNLEYDYAFQRDERKWRALLCDLRRPKDFEGIDSSFKEGAELLVEEFGLSHLPTFENPDQFLTELRQLRAAKDKKNPQWWHQLKDND